MFAAKEVFKTTSVVKYLGSGIARNEQLQYDQTPLLTLNEALLLTYIFSSLFSIYLLWY